MILRSRIDPLSPCLGGPLELPGPLQPIGAGRSNNPAPSRCKGLLAIVKIVGASLRPRRHRHRNCDGPVPGAAKPPDASDLVPFIVKDEIVLDAGPGRTGIE